MAYIHSRFSRIGLLGSLLSVTTLACSAEDPTPINPNASGVGTNTGVTPGTPNTPGVTTTPVTPGQSTIAAAPAQTPVQQPAVTPGSVPGGSNTGAVQPPATPGSSLPQPPNGQASAPAGTTPAPAETPAPAQMPAAEPEPEPAAEPEPAGEGNALTPNNDLWVGPTSNGVGVVGSWYGYQDESTTGCCEGTLMLEDGAVCMTGTTAAGEEGNYDIWGAGMGFEFNESDPWDGSAYSGISFTATVTSDADVLVKMKQASVDLAGADHFVALKSGTNNVTWASLAQPDWVAAADATDFDPSDIEAVQIQVQPGDGAANDFTVCISDMTVTE